MISSNTKTINAQNNLEELILSTKSLTLATINNHQQSHSSYAPFTYVDQKFYIIISSISAHTKNIIKNPKIGGMIIEDEQKSNSIWFRRRIHYHFHAKRIENPPYKIMQKLENNFGPMFKKLQKINFIIFELSILDGLMLLGPGLFFNIDNHNNIKS